jgi:hypothetical protein
MEGLIARSEFHLFWPFWRIPFPVL